MSDQFQQFTDRAGEAAQETARRSSRQAQAFSNTGMAFTGSMQDILREWMSWAQASYGKAQAGMLEITECRSPQALLEVQARLLREHAELLMASANRISEITTGLTHTAAETAATTRKNLVQ